MNKQDKIFADVTARIIKNLEGAGKWSRPWDLVAGDAPHNAITGRPYSGINLMILALSGFPSPQWMTYKQAVELGGNVKKGETSTAVIFFKPVKKEVEGKNESFAIMRTYNLFNIAQCENIDTDKVKAYEPPVTPENGVIDIAKNLGANVVYGGNSACFIPSVDQINMPSVDSFKDFDNHEATLLHELVHWTGRKDRLDRLSKHEYAEEELVAEIGAAMCGAVLGIAYEGLQHEEYIGHWLKTLKGDDKHIQKAAAMAAKASAYIVDNGLEAEEHESMEKAA